jgi:hypothetical protein
MLRSMCPTALRLQPRKTTTFPLLGIISSIGGPICMIREPAHRPIRHVYASITVQRSIGCSMSIMLVSYSTTDQLILTRLKVSSSLIPIPHRKRNSFLIQASADNLSKGNFSICQGNPIKHYQLDGSAISFQLPQDPFIDHLKERASLSDLQVI